VGDLTKDEVRNIAKKARLPVAGKTESQDICFIPERKYHRFLSERTNGQKRGPIMTLEGEILGEHKGAAFYTIGQRGGLGVGYRHPLYVVSTDTKKNSLTVGKKEDLYSRGLIAGSVNLLVKDLPQKASAKIRYNQSEAKCEVFPGQDKDKIKVIFKELQEAVTPGQSVVLYDNDTILAGGIIEEAIRR